MILGFDPLFDMVDIAGSAEELTSLADAVAAGQGLLDCASAPGRNTLAGVEVRPGPGPGVLVQHDAERRILVISGDAEAREALAGELRDMALAEDGGHLHIELYPEHDYVAEGSLSLVVNSPHGGMPRR
ncbi:hypothetical protein ABZY31_11275 [Streptomyces sp. NPDC006529]|uniref:Imm32 family immunity protein n=1 Tax=Streptomyces sp. NPDC006529 TaxID=3157177 RepID=UPI0033A97FCA